MLQAGFIFSCTIVLYYFLSYINQYLLLSSSFVNWDFFSTNFAHMCVSFLSIFLAALFFGRVSGFNFKGWLCIKQGRSTVFTLLVSALLGVVLVPFVTQINNIFIHLLSPILKNTEVTLTATPSTLSGLFFLMGTHALYPAFAEELFFRGVLTSPIQNKISPRLLIWFSALLFAVSHFSLKLLVATFTLGIVFSTATHKTKSLLPAMLIHFVYNAVSLIVNFLSVDWILITDFSNWTGYLAFAIKMISSITLIVILLYSYKDSISIVADDTDTAIAVNSTDATPVESTVVAEDTPPIRMLDFVSFLPGAFLLLMSFMQEISFI